MVRYGNALHNQARWLSAFLAFLLSSIASSVFSFHTRFLLTTARFVGVFFFIFSFIFILFHFVSSPNHRDRVRSSEMSFQGNWTVLNTTEKRGTTTRTAFSVEDTYFRMFVLSFVFCFLCIFVTIVFQRIKCCYYVLAVSLDAVVVVDAAFSPLSLTH